jgi:hypothetical protein
MPAILPIRQETVNVTFVLFLNLHFIISGCRKTSGDAEREQSPLLRAALAAC